MAFSRTLCFYVLTALVPCLTSSKKVSEPSVTEELLSDRTSHPAKFAPPSGQINVTMGMSLIKILTVRPERNEVEFIAWMSYNWNDPSLAWDHETEENSVSLPSSLVWIPDIVPWTTTDPVVNLFPVNVVVTRTGDVIYMPAQRMTNSCKVNKPRDGVTSCRVKMGSWTTNGDRLSLKKQSDTINVSDFQNSNFAILSSNVTLHEKYYACCPERYVDIMFDFTFKVD